MASFTATVGVDDLPASYTFAVADDQTGKDDDGNELDGGEKYDGSDVDYTHTGLSLAATMDAGMIEVEYTTQTLIAYVHEELDQVFGYTGNIIGGDARDVGGVIDVGIRYIDPSSGRSRTFAEDDWDKDENTDDDDGVWTFSHVPADANVIVQASKADDASNHMLLDKDGHSDELATYRDLLTQRRDRRRLRRHGRLQPHGVALLAAGHRSHRSGLRQVRVVRLREHAQRVWSGVEE